jgi:hypothetical protein
MRTFPLSGYLCNWILKVATANRAVALPEQKPPDRYSQDGHGYNNNPPKLIHF